MPASSEQLQEIRKSIADSNAEFAAAPREKKRVMLAKDVLFQLSIDRIAPTSAYFKLDPRGNILADNRDRQVQDLLFEVPQCQVCGIGSLFLVAVERLDALTVRDIIGDMQIVTADSVVAAARYPITQYLEKHDLFSGTELQLIENFFEAQRYTNYYWKWSSAEGRMRQIMEVIVRTEGAELKMGMLDDEYPTKDKIVEWRQVGYDAAIDELKKERAELKGVLE